MCCVFSGEVDLCPENVNDQPAPKSLICLMQRDDGVQKKRKSRNKTRRTPVDLCMHFHNVFQEFLFFKRANI